MMNIWSRMVESITERGLKRTMQSTLNVLEDHLFDIRYGTDTVRRVSVRALDINSENKGEAKDYIPTRGRAFRKLLDKLSFPSGSVFVDLGSGKGKLLLVASQYEFRRVVGVEFSAELCEIAKWNKSNYHRKKRVNADIEIVNADVVGYDINDDENVFFLFNPFGPVVLGKVLENIKLSLEKQPRKVWLIYNDPAYRDLIEQQGIFVSRQNYVYGGYEFIVYTGGR